MPRPRRRANVEVDTVLTAPRSGTSLVAEVMELRKGPAHNTLCIVVGSGFFRARRHGWTEQRPRGSRPLGQVRGVGSNAHGCARGSRFRSGAARGPQGFVSSVIWTEITVTATSCGKLDRRAEIAALRRQHQALDDTVRAMESQPLPDQLQIVRVKERKLALGDRIMELEDQITPNVIQITPNLIAWGRQERLKLARAAPRPAARGCRHVSTNLRGFVGLNSCGRERAPGGGDAGGSAACFWGGKAASRGRTRA